MNHVYAAGLPILLVSFIMLIVGTLWFHSYTGLTREKAYLALVVSVIAGGLRTFYHLKEVRNSINSENEFELFVSVGTAGLLVVFVAAFVLRLWGRWIGNKATPAERLPGVDGIRAWFCASNVFVGGAIILCAWLGEDLSPILAVVIVGALLAAYPLLRIESPTVAAPMPEDLSPEREKIVSMLEAGKLTPEESAELLQALGDSSRAPSHQVPLTGSQRLMLIGAALVALGFFLPWIVIDPGKEASRMMQHLQSSVHSTLGKTMPMAGEVTFPTGQFQTGNMSFSGGDLQRGLGWAALALALAAALLPYVATGMDAATARTVRLLCLGTGAIIVLYVLTQNHRFIGIGLAIAVAGYALEITGAMRERRTALA